MSSRNERPLDGRTAVITGGARGIGFALAGSLAEAGARIAVLDRLEMVRESATRLGGAAVGIEVDVTDERSIDAAFEAIERDLGVADVLVNCAGITDGTPALEVPIAVWERVFSVNVTGTLAMSQAFVRRYLDARPVPEATIVNVSSMSAFDVNVPQTQAAYNASKAAVTMLTKSTAIEWLPLGVRVNAIAPGYIASDMTRDFVAAHPRMADEWLSRIPAGRMGSPEELADLVVYLASPRSSYVVGQSILIDGGYTLV